MDHLKATEGEREQVKSINFLGLHTCENQHNWYAPEAKFPKRGKENDGSFVSGVPASTLLQ